MKQPKNGRAGFSEWCRRKGDLRENWKDKSREEMSKDEKDWGGGTVFSVKAGLREEIDASFQQHIESLRLSVSPDSCNQAMWAVYLTPCGECHPKALPELFLMATRTSPQSVTSSTLRVLTSLPQGQTGTQTQWIVRAVASKKPWAIAFNP